MNIPPSGLIGVQPEPKSMYKTSQNFKSEPHFLSPLKEKQDKMPPFEQFGKIVSDPNQLRQPDIQFAERQISERSYQEVMIDHVKDILCQKDTDG